MARPARAAAKVSVTKVKASVTRKSVKVSLKSRKAAGASSASGDDDDASELDEQSSTSSDDGDGADDYKEPDSDAIDESSEDDAQLDEEDGDTAIDEDSEASNREHVIDFSVKKKGSPASTNKKRKGKGAAKSESGTPSKRVKKAKKGSEDDDFDESLSEEEDEELLEDGRKLTRTKLVKAPSSSVKAGIIDANTFKFLKDLALNNDREWFAKNGQLVTDTRKRGDLPLSFSILTDARYRHAWKNWNDFVGAVQAEITRGDWQIPEMPAKDLVYRIYRDVRFSNDKTPYKKNFSSSFSRTGRKGPFAGYYLQISPGRSLVAGGKWSPEKNDLATIRSNILRSSKPLRKVLNNPDFVKHFGPAKVDGHGKGKRCSVFNHDDMLKVKPKIDGVRKDHKDIDLLKLRTMAVVYNFSDEEVLSPDFKTRVGDVVGVMAPLVQLINDMTHPQSEDENAVEESEEEEEDPTEDEKNEVTAASGREPSDPENSDGPVEEDDADGVEGSGGVESA